jgi:ligand-binding sensor domain-containing protein
MKMEKAMQKILAILFFASSCNCFCNAQDLQKRFAFTTADGLPSNHVYSVAEDTSGFLWIATDNGVSRFDGKKFRNYGVEQAAQMCCKYCPQKMGSCGLIVIGKGLVFITRLQIVLKSFKLQKCQAQVLTP